MLPVTDSNKEFVKQLKKLGVYKDVFETLNKNYDRKEHFFMTQINNPDVVLDTEFWQHMYAASEKSEFLKQQIIKNIAYDTEICPISKEEYSKILSNILYLSCVDKTKCMIPQFHDIKDITDDISNYLSCVSHGSVMTNLAIMSARYHDAVKKTDNYVNPFSKWVHNGVPCFNKSFIENISEEAYKYNFIPFLFSENEEIIKEYANEYSDNLLFLENVLNNPVISSDIKKELYQFYDYGQNNILLLSDNIIREINIAAIEGLDNLSTIEKATAYFLEISKKLPSNVFYAETINKILDTAETFLEQLSPQIYTNGIKSIDHDLHGTIENLYNNIMINKNATPFTIKRIFSAPTDVVLHECNCMNIKKEKLDFSETDFAYLYDRVKLSTIGGDEEYNRLRMIVKLGAFRNLKSFDDKRELRKSLIFDVFNRMSMTQTEEIFQDVIFDAHNIKNTDVLYQIYDEINKKTLFTSQLISLMKRVLEAPFSDNEIRKNILRETVLLEDFTNSGFALYSQEDLDLIKKIRREFKKEGCQNIVCSLSGFLSNAQSIRKKHLLYAENHFIDCSLTSSLLFYDGIRNSYKTNFDYNIRLENILNINKEEIKNAFSEYPANEIKRLLQKMIKKYCGTKDKELLYNNFNKVKIMTDVLCDLYKEKELKDKAKRDAIDKKLHGEWVI